MLLPETKLSGAWPGPPGPMDIAEFFPEHPSGYYAFPVDPDSMCLDVFGGVDVGREMAMGTADCYQPIGLPTTGRGGSIRRFSSSGASPNSSFDFGGPRSPNAFSDSGKGAKPQYTAELDVLCRICGDRASGFHYGVHSCEGCKGFFRRTLKKQLVYRPCLMGKQCKIDAGTRNKCQHCRYQRCLNAGMSQDAVRFGRMPKTEREKLVADKEELWSTGSKRIVELRSLADLIKTAFRDVFQHTVFFQPPAPGVSPSPSAAAPHGLHTGGVGHWAAWGSAADCRRVGYFPHAVSSSSSPPLSSSPSSSSSPFDATTMEVVTVQAVNIICGVFQTMEVVTEVLHSVSAEDFQDLEVFWRFQETLVPVLEASVKFAKRLPGFAALPMPDQIDLMKRNGFMVVQLAFPALVDRELIKLDSGFHSLRLSRYSPCLCEELQKLLQRPLAVGDRLRSMRLTHGELALFAAVLLTSYGPRLMSPKPVEALQADLIEALRLDLKHNHPKDRLMLPKLLLLIPDLVQIVEEFSANLQAGVFDSTPNFARTKPLLREIFDLHC
ncbi:hypothetical protein ACOMHN_005948 [Nucella lapillus]